MKSFSRLLVRFRYPFSLPEDIAEALGVSLSNASPFKDIVDQLVDPSLKPTKLNKFMSREEAEEAFENAPCKERFGQSTLVSYYFNEGSVQFILKFGDKKLRRMYFQHKSISQPEGIEIPLSCMGISDSN